MHADTGASRVGMIRFGGVGSRSQDASAFMDDAINGGLNADALWCVWGVLGGGFADWLWGSCFST